MGNKKKSWVLFKTFVILLIIIGILFIGYRGTLMVVEWLPSFQKEDISALYNGIHEDYTYVLLEEQPIVLDNYPKIIDNQIYLPIDFVIQYLNPNFYWDAQENTLTYTTLNSVIRMKTDELTYFVNDAPLTLNLPVRVLEDQVAYIPSELLKQFSAYTFSYNSELDLLMIDDETQDANYTTIINKEAVLRVDQDAKSKYLVKLLKDEQVKIYGESNDWFKVRTEEGILGYIKKKVVGNSFVIQGVQVEAEVSPFIDPTNYGGKVNIVWHQVTNATANSYVQDAMANVKGVDVLSPTWFAISDSEGNVSNLADISYVHWAHEQGTQIWALISNSFSSAITHDVLSSTAKREFVIKQILAFASLYELDGINIDFENVAAQDGPAYVEFIKEIGPYLNKQGILVSVDMYVPTAWTAHYNRSEVAKSVDYVVIMAYDEHWSTSPESGSVASIGFVDSGIVNTLKEVPKEKVILGLPYYTRIWAEQLVDEKIVVSSEAYGMKGSYDILVENNAVLIWDDEVKQFYAEYILEGITYKCWLEEEKSIEEKVLLMEKYDIAGVAGWKLGLQKEEIWDVLNTYLKE